VNWENFGFQYPYLLALLAVLPFYAFLVGRRGKISALHFSSADLARAAVKVHYARSEENQFLEVIYRSGKRDILYRGDLASGAIIAAVVERAKSLAIKRAIETKQETHLTREYLLAALQREYQENDLFPSTDVTEDWLKLTDFDPDNVIKLGPIRPRRPDTIGNAIV